MRLTARATEAPQPYVVPPSNKFDGADGSWSTFKISVGTPGQDFRVLPSTKGGVIYVVAEDGCLEGVDPADCPQRRGIEVFQSAESTGFQVDASTTWSATGQYDVDLEDALNYTGRGLFGLDTVTLGAAADSGSSASLTRQVVAAIADLDYYLGVLGLGQAKSSFNSGSQPVESFLYLLRESKRIPSFAYAYTAGASYRLKSVFGNLVLGGYDATRFERSANDFAFTFSQDPSRLLTVGVDSIMATNTLQGTYSLTSGAHFSVIDSTVPHLWLPTDVCAEFETAFGLTYDPQTDLYLVNDTIHEELVSKNPTLTFKLVDSLEDTTTNYTNIELPYAAFDLQASYPYYTNATNYFPIRRAANDSQYVLGRTLLQEAYLIVDYERANFTVAQAVFPNPLPAADVVTIRSPSDSGSTQASPSSPGLGAGAVAGIVIGVIAALLLVIIGIFFFRKHRGKQQKEEPYELASKQLSEIDSGSNILADSLPHKALAPQELHGTPLTELASPFNDPIPSHAYPQDQKIVIDMADEPQELHGDSIMPVTPRWQEVPPHARFHHGMGAESSASHSVSGVPSDDGYATGEFTLRSGVSPISPQFPHNKYG